MAQNKRPEEFKAQKGEPWATKKEGLFQSTEFYDLLRAKSTSFLDKGFKRAIKQFKETGYPLEGIAPDFLDMQKVLNHILDEDMH